MSVPRILGGRYEVGTLIGFGATADVHRGRDLRTGRSVAIKVLHERLARLPQFQAALVREVRLAAALRHPGIVSIYDSGIEEVKGGSAGRARLPFLVMEYVPGRSLRDIVRGGGLVVETSIRFQMGVLAALDFSHRAGVVHRDIKPANVMVTTGGAIKLVDFGIARAIDDPSATQTRTGSALGTPSYISPEQVRGETADARSDLYSAGCLFHELLSGRPPFVGDDPVSIAYQHVHAEPTPISTVEPALGAVLAKALAKDRANRFQDARSFLDALLSATSRTRAIDDSPTKHLPHHTERRNASWDSSPSGKRTAARSSSTTRTKGRVSPSSSFTATL